VVVKFRWWERLMLKFLHWLLDLLGWGKTPKPLPTPERPEDEPVLGKRTPRPPDPEVTPTSNGRVSQDPDREIDEAGDAIEIEPPPPEETTMGVTAEQKEVIDAVLSIFETGKVPSPDAYSAVTVLRDGAGISYGKHQATDRSDSLDRIVMTYIDRGGLYAAELAPYVEKLDKDMTAVDPSNLPQWVKDLMEILKKAGQDLTMVAVQDDIFDEGYWIPAVNQAEDMKLVHPLSYLIVYDTCIQSGPGGVGRIRRKFAEVPPSKGGDEKAWALAYVKARHNWLATHSNTVVQQSKYRTQALLDLIDAGRWELNTPLTVRGQTID